MEVSSAQICLRRVVHATRQRIVRKRSILKLADKLIIDNLIAITLDTIERRLFILGLTRETETEEGAVTGNITVFVLDFHLIDRTCQIYLKSVEKTIVKVAFPTHQTLKLAGWRFQSNNLSTADSFTNAGRRTTKNNLNLSDSILRH